MTLKQTKKREHGFTIVELLIVVVIIAILAAITIVAYNGIQNRAKASAAQSLANSIGKKAEAYNATESKYPTSATGFGNGDNSAGNPAEAKLDNQAQVTGTAPTDEKTVMYKQCTTGAQVTYYDAVAKATKIVALGGASSTTAC